MRKVFYIITIINILFQAVYMTIGKYTTSEMGILKYVFYIFRPEYMIVSGIVALLVGCGVLILIVKSIKSFCFSDMVVLLLNVEYIIFYLSFLSKQ